jgi:hypothetical protein
MQFFNDSLGRIFSGSWTVADVSNGGFSFNPNKQLSRVGTAQPTDVWIGGVRVSALGELVIDSTVGGFDSNNGVPCSNDPAIAGAPYRISDIIPAAIDYPVCGGSLVTGLNNELHLNNAAPPIGAQQLVNPEFTTDVANWTGSNATLAWAAGVCVVTGTAFPASNLISQTIPPQAVQVGWAYRCEARIRNVTSNSGPRLRAARGAPGGNSIITASSFVPGTTFTDVSIDFVPRFSDLDITVQATPIAVGEIFEVEYVRLWLLGV